LGRFCGQEFRLLSAFAAILLVSASVANAQFFSFQGRITDTGGVPLNGVYDVEFKLFDAYTGGSQIGSTVAKHDVQITDGILSSGVTFFEEVSFVGDDFYMEILIREGASTGAYESLGRSYIGYAPRAINALRVDSLLGRNAGDVEYRSPYDMRFYLDSDDDQSNEWFSVHNSTGDFLLLLREDGSLTATAGSGDAGVVFTVGSISAIENESEAGVVSNFGGDSILETAVPTSLVSTTITAPTSGYVLVVAGITGLYTIASTHSYRTSFDISTDVSIGPDSVLSYLQTGVTVPMSLHKVFPVTAGTTTFHFVGRAIDAAVLLGARISAIFVPTTYGTVSASANLDDGRQRTVDQSFLEAAEERAAAIEANQSRIRRELEEMEAQIRALKEEARLE
jgi:hypothetical protein